MCIRQLRLRVGLVELLYTKKGREFTRESQDVTPYASQLQRYGHP